MDNETYKNLLKKRQRARELRRFRPANMTEGELMMSPDLEYIGGEFSTFDSKLSQLMKTPDGLNVAREYIKNQLTQTGATPLNKSSAEIACLIFDCLYQNQPLALRAIESDVHGDVKAWNDFFEVVIGNLNSIYKPEKHGGFVDVGVINSWTEIGEDEEKNKHSYAMLRINPDVGIKGAVHYDIYINRNKVRKIKVGKSSDPLKLLIEMIKSFAHEYRHLLDLKMPNRGALGAQFVAAAKKIYVKGNLDYKKYRDNPLEISAFNASKMLHVLDVPDKR